jgi:hypothetical protein
MRKFEKREVQLRKMFLDNENARHDPIANEPEIIALLIEKLHVKALASDIAAQDATSPLDQIGVFPHPLVKDAYLVAEGNRRVCALKLLNDPDKAPDGHRVFFRDLAAKMPAKPDLIDVVVFKNREDSRRWIELRHEGPQGGVGTVAWDARAKVRHNTGAANPKNPNIQAAALLNYARARRLITQRQFDEINITTITRFLTNPVFRDTLGLVNHKDTSIIVEQQDFDQGLKRFLSDSLDGDRTGVNSRTDAAARKNYASKLRRDVPMTRLQSPAKLDPATGKAAYAKGESATASKRPRHHNPDRRTHVIDEPIPVKIKNKALIRIYNELREVNCQQHAFAASFLLRAMIELPVKIYCRQNGIGVDKQDLATLIGKVHDKLVQDGVCTAPQLKPLRVMANDRHGICSPETLGSFVHGGSIPAGSQLNRGWDSVEDSVTHILSQLK